MSELTEKYERDGALGYLDIADTLERIIPGGTEKERNDSRLHKIITGESRPAKHTANEAAAWLTADVALPLLVAFTKGAALAARTKRGVEIINSFAKPGTGVQTTMKVAEKATKESAEKAAKDLAKKKAAQKAEDKAGNSLGKLLSAAFRGETADRIKARAAKSDAKSVGTAISVLSSGSGPARELFEKAVKDTALKSGIGTKVAETTGDVVANNVGREKGLYSKMEDLEDFDNRIEIGSGRRLWQFIKGIVDLDDLNPKNYPMDTINDVLTTLVDRTGAWKGQQIRKLGDDEKIKLVKDLAKGKYDTEERDLSYELYKAYMDLTNK